VTQRRNQPSYAISNYFDDLSRGIGKRGSSFTDIDAISHDKDTGRFLFQEFKNPREHLHPAQRLVLRELAYLPRCTVWFVRRLGENQIGWAQFGSGCRERVISEAEYQELLRRWWYPDSASLAAGAVDASEIHW
jgi:hypothetical protein